MSCSRIDRQDSALSALALNPAGSHCDVGLHSVTRCSVPNYSHETHGMTRTSLQKTEKIQTKDPIVTPTRSTPYPTRARSTRCSCVETKSGVQNYFPNFFREIELTLAMQRSRMSPST